MAQSSEKKRVTIPENDEVKKLRKAFDKVLATEEGQHVWAYLHDRLGCLLIHLGKRIRVTSFWFLKVMRLRVFMQFSTNLVLFQILGLMHTVKMVGHWEAM